MNESHIEELITSLYDMIQDARAMPLGADKCILEREKALDILDELSAQLPGELKQSRTIVESRNELISQARREAEAIIRQAQEQAQQMVSREAVCQQAKVQAEDMIRQAQTRIRELRKASNDYMDDALRRAEEAIAQSLGEVRDTRVKFRALTEAQEKRSAAEASQPRNG